MNVVALQAKQKGHLEENDGVEEFWVTPAAMRSSPSLASEG